MSIADKIKQAYKDLATKNNVLPFSVKEIAVEADLDADTVHEYFSSTTALQMAIWKEYFTSTLDAIGNSPEYMEYGSREKLLAFYFTLFEVLREEREFAKMFLPQFGIWNLNPEILLPLKRSFLKFVKAILEEGKENGEIQERYVLGEEYAGWHWPQFMYLLNHWLRDKSEDFTDTDKAIEKAVNLGFDIMERNVLDSAVEFAKFIFTRS